MEIYDFINSRDVAKYLKDNNYEFTTSEMVCIIGRSNKSQAEKFPGFKYIMENFPDEPKNVSKFFFYYGYIKDQKYDYVKNDNEFIGRFYNDIDGKLIKVEHDERSDNWFLRRVSKIDYDEMADNIIKTELERRKEYKEDSERIVEFNVTPFYNTYESFELYKKWNPDSNITEEQKATFDEKLNYLFENPIISYTGGITEEDFDKITHGMISLFCMLNFYMQNTDRFYDNANDLFPLNLPLPFKPGDCVRPYWQTDTDKMYVIIDKYNDDDKHGGEINSFVVYTNGSVEGPVKFTDDMKEYELFNYEFVKDESCPETAKILRRCINRERNGFHISLENVAEALNEQREFILELVQQETDNDYEKGCK